MESRELKQFVVKNEAGGRRQEAKGLKAFCSYFRAKGLLKLLSFGFHHFMISSWMLLLCCCCCCRCFSAFIVSASS